MGFIFLICTNNNIFGQLYTDNSIIVQKEELKIEKKMTLFGIACLKTIF